MHTFSAFWLRSSVVSVLISLISDTDLIEIEDIKLIFDVARIASGLPVLSVTGCLCIAVSQSTADPARGFTVIIGNADAKNWSRARDWNPTTTAACEKL